MAENKLTANLIIQGTVKGSLWGQYRKYQGTISGTVNVPNKVVRVSFSLSILKLAEVDDCNGSKQEGHCHLVLTIIACVNNPMIKPKLRRLESLPHGKGRSNRRFAFSYQCRGRA